jgi:hypothetical protein
MLTPYEAIKAKLISSSFCNSALILDNTFDDRITNTLFTKHKATPESDTFGVLIGLAGHKAQPANGKGANRTVELKHTWTIGLFALTEFAFTQNTANKFDELISLILSCTYGEGCNYFEPMADERDFNEPDVRNSITFFPSTWQTEHFIRTI